MASDPRQRLTIEEYLAFERSSETKHDYFEGEIFDMSGASRKHNRLTVNIATELQNQLEDRDCEVYAHDLRVRTPGDLFTYPDVAVVCGQPEFDDNLFDTLLNPIVIVEVLSPTTETYDRTTKLAHYRAIPSLQEALLIAQDKIYAEHYIRQGSHEWLLREIDADSEKLEISSVRCVLGLQRVYRRVFD